MTLGLPLGAERKKARAHHFGHDIVPFAGLDTTRVGDKPRVESLDQVQSLFRIRALNSDKIGIFYPGDKLSFTAPKPPKTRNNVGCVLNLQLEPR
ncbi:hypothetical protein OOU_Y34scaffold00608g88 [Pyricularia oryzae Y34]|uniref:Uncharacterized protein n=2 Tax=Pyricularia oryzae TaxID=318829 RepID=A0AA97PJU0_PYRO3|nr:hypothetical protein OOU_Y34scaffold00608g88 [Pyricularia oryzae Y34]